MSLHNYIGQYRICMYLYTKLQWQLSSIWYSFFVSPLLLTVYMDMILLKQKIKTYKIYNNKKMSLYAVFSCKNSLSAKEGNQFLHSNIYDILLNFTVLKFSSHAARLLSVPLE